MPCEICGEICRCVGQTKSNSAAPRWQADSGLDSGTSTEAEHAIEEVQTNLCAATEADSSVLEAESPASATVEEVLTEDSSAWRRELAERLNRYHSRRKPRPPRYPSLRLRFEEHPLAVNASDVSSDPPAVLGTSTYSNCALALQSFEAPADSAEPVSPAVSATELSPETFPPPVPATARILEFPRSGFSQHWLPPAPAANELAEPAFLPLRILEVPEVVPPPPALGGITIEPPPLPDVEKRPGIDIPLRGATIGRRVFAAAADALIIAASCAMFSFIFWTLTAIRPPRLQIAGVLASLGIVLWAAYQYLLLVYTGNTPGLRLAKLRLARFEGSTPSRKLRRWRVLASFLSALSLGMGYAWVFLDEDSLCWHDRITHTYLEQSK
jgi:uncharacterized RDD family membrane protein YckC